MKPLIVFSVVLGTPSGSISGLAMGAPWWMYLLLPVASFAGAYIGIWLLKLALK